MAKAGFKSRRLPSGLEQPARRGWKVKGRKVTGLVIALVVIQSVALIFNMAHYGVVQKLLKELLAQQETPAVRWPGREN